MAESNLFVIPKVTILYPGGDQLTSLLLEKEKNTIIKDLIERLCTLRAIDTKDIRAYSDVGKKIDTKLTVAQSGIVFIELIDKKVKNKKKEEKDKDYLDAGEGKIRKGKPDKFVLKIGQGVDLPLREQLFDDEWESLQNFKSKNEICKSYCDHFIMCCLWSRKFDEARTLKLLQDNLQWRKSNGFERIPSISELEETTRGLSLLYNIIPGARDKNGGGIVYCTFKKELVFGKEPFTVSNVKKWIAWYYNIGIFQDGLDALRQGMTMIEDLTEFGWNHFDLDFQKQLNITHIFPIRVRRFVMVNPPLIFNAIIKVAKTFINAKMLGRIELTNNIKESSLKYVSPDQLWTNFGGLVDYSSKEWAEDLISWGHKYEAQYLVPLYKS